MPHLFDPITLRGVTLRNRIGVSPMCQYSSKDGLATDWHLVHLGSFALGGAGLVFSEAAAVAPEGRISPHDLGMWSDAHVEQWLRINAFLRGAGAASGVQLAHAGRKASTQRPWEGNQRVEPADGGWIPVAPSALAYSDHYAMPAALDDDGIAHAIECFRAAAARSLEAGFDVIELHAAHGYLAHQFLSPLTNERTNRWGGSFDNRIRFVRETAAAVRSVWPESRPLFVRLSVTDWADGGWDLEQSIALAHALAPLGVDVIDCSSGGLVSHQKIPIAPGYHVPFAERIKREAGIATAAVGLITTPEQAEAIVAESRADLVLLARELLRDPHFPLRAAKALGQSVDWPIQYARAK